MNKLKAIRPLKFELRDTLYRRRYLVPNAVTLGNMFCGFLCIIYAASDRFEKAVIAIAIALLLDGLDGRVARKLNATSKFGVELDSFADLVSFGIAPAILVYHWCFRTVADEFGVLVTFVFALCAASRLARFNISTENLKSFVGLPTPGAAGVVAAVVNFMPRFQPTWVDVTWCSALMLALAYLMVSNIEFFSIKLLKIRRMQLWGTIALGALIALIWYNSQIGFLTLTLLYAASGPVGLLRRNKTAAPAVETSDKRSA
jgi:CDP-diacylglycerol--serine O-phosphatidyltransferase